MFIRFTEHMRYKSEIKKLTKSKLSGKLRKIDVADKKESMLSSFGINPFLSDFKVVVNVQGKEGLYKKDEDDWLPVEYEYERDKKVNVYVDRKCRLVVAGLSNSAKCLYLHLLYEVEYGCDYIEVNVERYMRENGISSLNTYKSGLSELRKFGIMANIEGHKGIYWINPKYFFAGSRVEHFKDYVVPYKSKGSEEVEKELRGMA